MLKMIVSQRRVNAARWSVITAYFLSSCFTRLLIKKVKSEQLKILSFRSVAEKLFKYLSLGVV